MIKFTALLKRNNKLSHEEFVKHHIEKHGPLFKQIPEASEYVIRYIQTHPIPEKSAYIQTNDFDGTAEIWFTSLEGMEKVLTSEFFKNYVLPDEKEFLDPANTLITIGYQDDIIGDFTEADQNKNSKRE